MKVKVVSQERMKRLFSYDSGRIYWKDKRTTWIKAGDEAGSATVQGRHVVKIDGETYFRARIVAAMHHGDLVGVDIVDHINEIKNDDRIENLRITTTQLNNAYRGMRADNKSGYKGVCWHKRTNMWRATIDGQRCYYSNCKVDAALIYNFMAYEYFGPGVYFNGAENKLNLFESVGE